MNFYRHFEEKMKHLLRTRNMRIIYAADEPRHFGLRVNTNKIECGGLLKITPWPLSSPTPWIHNGFYYDGEHIHPANIRLFAGHVCTGTQCRISPTRLPV